MSDSGFDTIEEAAIRKTLNQLAGDRADLAEDGALEVADAATDRVNNLEQRVAKLEQLVDPDPGTLDYQAMTKAQRVHRIRVHLLKLARNDGTVTMRYRDVKQLFGGHPSTGYAYNLMEQTAAIDGFVYDTAADGKGDKRVRVKPDDVNDDRVIQSLNNGGAELHA